MSILLAVILLGASTALTLLALLANAARLDREYEKRFLPAFPISVRDESAASIEAPVSG